jgi:hypothetical protein
VADRAQWGAAPALLVAELLDVPGCEPDAQWWSGLSVEGQTQLTDEAVDWIEIVANDEG